MRFKLMYFTFCILIFWCCAEIIPGLSACPKNHTLTFFFPILLPRECVWGLRFTIQVAGKWNLIWNVCQALQYRFFSGIGSRLLGSPQAPGKLCGSEFSQTFKAIFAEVCWVRLRPHPCEAKIINKHLKTFWQRGWRRDGGWKRRNLPGQQHCQVQFGQIWDNLGGERTTQSREEFGLISNEKCQE